MKSWQTSRLPVFLSEMHYFAAATEVQGHVSKNGPKLGSVMEVGWVTLAADDSYRPELGTLTHANTARL